MKPFKESDGYAADLQEAYDYYKRYGTATAGRFLAAYETAVSIVMSSPYACRETPWLETDGHPRISGILHLLPRT